MTNKHDKHDKHGRRDEKAQRRALEKSLDGVAKAAREIAEKRIRERKPDLLDDR